MPFTEFCCRSGGSNINAGSLDGSSTEASTTPVYTATNGGWNSSTGVFTPVSGDPSASVSVGQFASVFIDGASVAVFVGRVTAVSSTTVTVSLTAKSGTAPTTNATARSIIVGGAWLGPNGSSAFPFGFVQSTLTNSAANPPRVNFKNNQQYNVTASIAHSLTGPVAWHGYSSAYGDGGQAVIDGGTVGTSYTLFNPTGAVHSFANLKFQNNGDTGTATGLIGGSRQVYFRCVVNDMRGHGWVLNNVNSAFIECEAYACNKANSANLAGFQFSNSGGCVLDRCISHHNTGSNAEGFRITTAVTLRNCIADSNGANGFTTFTTNQAVFMSGCESYNNGGHGLILNSNSTVYVENCNFLKNGGWGIQTAGTVSIGALINNRFGAGTQINTSGTVNIIDAVAIEEIGSASYAADVTPWVDPANGDFRINLDAAKNNGRGAFLQTQAGYAGTVGFPDIGAAQAICSAILVGLFKVAWRYWHRSYTA